MSMIKLTVVGILAVGIVGCSTAPKKIAFNRELTAHVKTIAVVQQKNQASYPARILAHAGANFALIGALVAEAEMAAKSSTLTKALSPYKVDLQDRVHQSLMQKLTEKGYTVAAVKLPEGTADSQVVTVAADISKSDAVMVVNSTSAYIAANHTAPYRPQVRISAEVYDSKTKKSLYKEAFNYGFANQFDDAVMVNADEQYNFSSMSEITKRAQDAASGLTHAIEPLTERIASDIKK
jgi:hypothetical protein